jgi:hypothetical protein
MHHIADILSQDVSTTTLERLARVELLCVREEGGSCLASPDGDAVFTLRGYTGRRGATLLHVFDDDASEFAELVMALVDDAGLPLSYKDADTEADFTDAAGFGAWLGRQEGPQMRVLFERMQDLL